MFFWVETFACFGLDSAPVEERTGQVPGGEECSQPGRSAVGILSKAALSILPLEAPASVSPVRPAGRSASEIPTWPSPEWSGRAPPRGRDKCVPEQFF